ncbi:SDR family NAD(P)-dependent oxidoreductase [Mesorhizobium sp. M7A.F.Ca.US.006.01.1.1]|uniref:SDR family NAD(P)-dependent oxidoreductase n=1 Tax=Mesorhizobium sp. M7A.F.Ca.US.006.01.1.1 TaxID=2496707 RepID=UPI000FCC1796|nr:SDR family NAD(P)-dependent oxidoreductase [Mesorhizobium sp. M7A.F.Ca.US.006.01.1.1]RUZ72794.1 SDR family NAD(P)-dependent oxidoreductase [Mesorhizobium sp. M7A.F.Ca.US.006.01.1.1]
MIDLARQVAIVTGAGSGLGRSHALMLASRGAFVVVNDLVQAAADQVAAEIVAAGGEAIGFAASVVDFEAVQAMVNQTITVKGRVDILVNNAGILRDKTFAKMDLADFRLIIDVHLMGAAHCTKAVWDQMREQGYGRIIMTTSSSGLYGNFGQSNYGAAKMALVGLMQTLALEGAKYGIHVNCIAPTAATQMFDGLLPQQELDLLAPDLVSPGVLFLASRQAPTKTILCAGAGSFESAHVSLTRGAYLGDGPEVAELLDGHWPMISDRRDDIIPGSGEAQGRMELLNAGYRRV